MQIKNKSKRVTGLVSLISALTLTACGNKDDAINAAENAGWKNIEVIEIKFGNYRCSRMTGKVREFGETYIIKGLNPRNEFTEAIVCHYNIPLPEYIIQSLN